LYGGLVRTELNGLFANYLFAEIAIQSIKLPTKQLNSRKNDSAVPERNKTAP
jgi:hypothetical protein